MNLKSINVLHVDLAGKEFVTKSYPDLKPLIGGVGIASKLILDNLDSDPIVIGVGPLNGFFPFASKTCAAFVSEGKFLDTYGGGKLSTRLGYLGFDAIVLEGKSPDPVCVSIDDNEVSFSTGNVDPETLGIPGRRSFISADDKGCLIDRYFYFGSNQFKGKLESKGVASVVVSSSSDYTLEHPAKYEKAYYDVLSMVNKMLVEPGGFPSCSGCPMGCSKSSEGEVGGNVLLHSLVGCAFAEPIYSSVPLVFACLNSLGYDYVHEDLEDLPRLIYSNISAVYDKIGNSELETK